MAPPERDFEVVWEIEPPLHADVAHLHAQLDSAAGVATGVLVPDNHTGRATVSSIAIAREVARQRAGGHGLPQRPRPEPARPAP